MKLMQPGELKAALREIGARRYRRLHPFHHLLHSGRCTQGQVQSWALNRYYYQAMIPIKDASLIALDYVKRHARKPDTRALVLSSVFWAMLDALRHAYVEPGHIPSGAFLPDGRP